ncbi:protein HEADING DATE 3B isoform X2 [Hevea brasiliensis]|uniref:protein HEADING DATE 3B isoform X2 n=1 Tax=Hevea brasiliensis TaxID=3981 RepID=UPI0025CFFEEE|nr:protein HEADING DATE 3B isoform X2 [Hevea brasiliensis]
MMRGLKDEEKVISPMFPRLHVNDTEKRGPRAPPRNKMALYEQLSIPSQRFSSGSSPMLPLPPNSGRSSVPSMSSSHGGGYERSVFTPFCNSPAPSHSEKPFSQSFSGVKPSSKMESQVRKSMSSRNDQSLNITQQLSSSAKCNSFHSYNFSNFKSFSLKKLGDESDFRVPSSAQSGAVLHCSSSQQSKDQENRPCWNLSFSMHFQNVSEKQKKGAGSINQKARESMRNQNEENTNMSEACQDPMERSASVPSILDKPSADVSSSPSGKVKSSESLKRAHPLSNQEHRSSSLVVLKSLHGKSELLNQNFVVMQAEKNYKDNFLMESAGVIGKENASKVRSETCPRLSLGNDIRSHNGIENGRKNLEDKQQVSLQVGNVEQHDDVLETTMVDSLSALDINPDELVRVIGEKQFWKARRTIVNQQRVFTVQVFELHRIMKVQKLIAGSPELFLEENIYLGKAPSKSPLGKKFPSENAIEQPSLIVKPKDSSHKQYAAAEFADENVVGKLPLPSVNNETGKGLLTHQSNYASYSEGALPAPVATNTRPSPWCFLPPGNQWLVPVMSPSEGLVYKPYTGPCPPTAGFRGPVYGNCGPMSLTAGNGDFLNAAYGVPASHQQGIGILASTPHLGQTYFPPYGMPVMTPSISGSAVEQSSCNMSSQMSRVISHIGKFRASKESELQGSTASGPSERPKGDALPLFPTEPTAQASDQNAQTIEPRTSVVRVVPHNPRSATESAARILRSIQEERKQYD